MGLASADANCGTTLTGDTVLASNKTSTGTCFTIGAHSITLDCNGHSITHLGVEKRNHYGIRNKGYDNVVVKNCEVNNFTGLYAYSNANNLQIINSSFSSAAQRGILIVSSSDTSIINSSAYSGKYYAVLVSRVKRLNITNSTFSSNTSFALYDLRSQNTTISNSTFFSYSGRAGYVLYSLGLTSLNSNFLSDAGYGLYHYRSNHSTYSGGLIQTFLKRQGAYIRQAFNNTISGVTIRTNDTQGVYIYQGNNNTIRESDILSTLRQGAYLNRANSTKIINSTVASENSYGLYVVYSRFNQFINSTFKSYLSYGAYINVAPDNTAVNSTFYSNRSRGLYQRYSNNVQLINSSFISSLNIGLYVYRSNHSTYTDSNAQTYGRSYGTYLYNSFNDTFYNSTMSSNSSYGAIFQHGANNSILHSIVRSNSSYGFYANKDNSTRIINSSLLSGTYIAARFNLEDYGTVINSSITSIMSYGLYLSTVRNLTITNTTISSGKNRGGYFIRANHTTILNSTIIANTSRALELVTSFYITIANSTLTTRTNYGFYSRDSRYIFIDNSTINGSSGYAALFYRSVDVLIKNSTFFTNPNNGKDIYLYQTPNVSIYNSSISRRLSLHCNSYDVQVVNTTINRSSIYWASPWSCTIIDPIQYLTVKWYLNFSVTTTNGSVASNTNINASASVFGFPIEVFNQTTDSGGNINNLTEFVEFEAIGPFTYNESDQANYLRYNNYTFSAVKTNYFINTTNRTINRSMTFSMVIEPVIPIIVNMSINREPPIFETTANATTPSADITDLTSPYDVNFTVWDSNGTVIYYNIPYEFNSSPRNFTGRNFSTPNAGIYIVNVTASDSKITVNSSYSFEVVNQAIIFSCSFQTQPYQHYLILAPLFCIDEDGVYLADGVSIDSYAPIMGFAMMNVPRAFVINGVDNVTINGYGGESVLDLPYGVWVNSSNNVTLLGMGLMGSNGWIELYINGTNGFYIDNGTYLPNPTGMPTSTIFIEDSRYGKITTFTGQSDLDGAFLTIRNSQNITIDQYTTENPMGVETWFDISDSDYITLSALQISNQSSFPFLPGRSSPHTLIKCERCNYFALHSSTLANAPIGLNLTDSNHTRAMPLGSLVEGPILGGDPAVTPTTFVLFIESAVLVYSTGVRSENNSFASYQITNSKNNIHLESKTGWNVVSTTFLNSSFPTSRFYPDATGLYSANATNTRLKNSTFLPFFADISFFPFTDIQESTLASIQGNTFLWLENTTYDPSNRSTSPGMDIHVAWGVEFTAYSDTGNTIANLNASNVSSSIVSSFDNATINETYYMLLNQGFTNDTCKPNMCLNQTNHTFRASAKYAQLNMTNLTIDGPQFVNLTVVYDPTKACGDVYSSIVLTQNISIYDPVCYNVLRPRITINCNGYWIISEGAGQIGINSTQDKVIIKGCHFNTSDTGGSFLAAIYQSSNGGIFQNNTFTIQGNITSIRGSANTFKDSSANVILKEGDRTFSTVTSTSIADNLLDNTTITASSSTGGTVFFSSIPLGNPGQFLWNITNSTIRVRGNVSYGMQVYDSYGFDIIDHSTIILDNINTPEALFLEARLGQLFIFDSSISTSTNRTLRISESTFIFSQNSSFDISQLVIGFNSYWNDVHSTTIFIQYANGSGCNNCLFNYTDGQGVTNMDITDEFGYVRDLPLMHFFVMGSQLEPEDSYFLLNESDQFNETSEASLTYFNPYNFTAIVLDYEGTNTSNAGGTIVILLNYSPIDDPPAISLNWPPDFMLEEEGVITFNATPVDDFNFTNVSLWIWDIESSELITVVLNDSVVSNGTDILLSSDLIPGTYEWNYQVCDAAVIPQCIFNETNRTIHVHNKPDYPPLVALNWPPDFYFHVSEDPTVVFSVIVFDDYNFTNASLRINGEIVVTNTSPFTNGSIVYLPYTFEESGEYPWTADVCDAAIEPLCSTNETTRTIIIEILPDDPPIVVLNSPENDDVFNTSNEIEFNYTGYDKNFTNASLWINITVGEPIQPVALNSSEIINAVDNLLNHTLINGSYTYTFQICDAGITPQCSFAEPRIFNVSAPYTGEPTIPTVRDRSTRVPGHTFLHNLHRIIGRTRGLR